MLYPFCIVKYCKCCYSYKEVLLCALQMVGCRKKIHRSALKAKYLYTWCWLCRCFRKFIEKNMKFLNKKP